MEVKNTVAIKNELTLQIESLGQKLFFNPTEVGPTFINPTLSKDWLDYIHSIEEMNTLLDEKSRVAKVIITSKKVFFRNVGFRTCYYHENILQSDDYDQRLLEITQEEKRIIAIESLDI